jgi:ABC-type glycerol-3-phosphate transport system substrate-binding protein
MKKWIFFTVIILIANVLSAQTGRLNVWAITDELKMMIDRYYRQTRPNVTVNYSLIPSFQFSNRLERALAAGKGRAPDVFALDSSFVRKFVESGMLLDLTDIYEANKARLIAYPVEVGTFNGRVYAMSWQAMPGAMFYRRSLARRYLGTDDPVRVQEMFSSFDRFMETAAILHQRSGGSCVVVASRGDLFNPFLGARSTSWVINGSLNIDPVMEQFMDISKLIHDNRYCGRVTQWSDGWFAGMKGELRDANFNHLEVFSYFLPIWGLHYVLKTNAPRSTGDWAVIQGPSPYHWGGTWLAAWKDTPNANAARDMIQFFTTNDTFLETWATDTGDIVPSNTVINRIRNNFSEPFLNGQNHYAAFADMVRNVNGRLGQSTDTVIEGLFWEAITAYVEGEKTKVQALAEFRTLAQRHITSLSY